MGHNFETSLELFNGFYSMNTMLLQISRKQEFASMVRDRKGTASDLSLIDEQEMLSINPRMYNLIGKDFVLQDSRDPLGATTKNSNEQKIQLDKYKLFLESRCDIDSVIFDFS
jgi:hypothetical protein